MSGRLRKHGRIRRRAHRPPGGSPPGTLVAPPAEAVATTIRLMKYGRDQLDERVIEALSEIDQPQAEAPVTWIDVQGLGTLDLLRTLGQRFGLHPLALADIVHVNQRAKVEAYEDHLFIVVRMPHLDDRIWTEPLSLIVGAGVVVCRRVLSGARRRLL